MFKHAFRTAVLFSVVFCASAAVAIDVLTFHNDNQRTGANTAETVLTQSNVNAAQFGKLYSRTVNGIMYAQPLYVSALTIGGGVHNVVFVATMKNNVYAFDADNGATPAYWTVNLGATVPNGEVYTNGDQNMNPEIGIVSTPVIDKAANAIYIVAMTKEGTASYAHRLHALDLATGAEKFGGPTLITANLFNSYRQGQRPALLLANGSVYFGFASFGDLTPYWGYMMRYNAATLAQQNVLNVNPANVNGMGAGIWQSGCGAAADAAGNIFFVTGNCNSAAGRDAKTGGVNYSECAVKLSSTGVTVADYFMPSDVDNIDNADADFGGGGHCLLPDMPGSRPHVMVCAGKNGQLYVIDRDNMTHYAADADARIIQKINIGSNKSTPTFWQSPNGPRVIVQSENTNATLLSYSVALNVAKGYIQLTQDKASTLGFQAHQRTLSSNGSTAGTGIIWTWSGTGGDLIHQTTPYAATLRAFNAETLAEIYNSGQNAARDTLGGFAKYNTATVANGRVYVPVSAAPTSASQLTVFGLLADTLPPTIVSASAVNLNTKVTVAYSEPVNAASAANIANYAINNGVTISGASLAADQMTLTLTTSTLSTGLTYTLTVNNVTDLAPAPNTIAANTQKTFTYSVVPPSVSIASPVANASFVAPAVIQVTANASAGANVTITKVDFFLNGSSAGTAAVPPYTVTLTAIAAGNYSLTATATDSSNYTATSAGVPVTVTAQTGAPYGLTTRGPAGPYLNGTMPPLISGSIPATLSALGAFSDLTALTPASALVPYGVNVPLWSDSAAKSRWMCVPNAGSPYTTAQQISFSPTGEWNFPNGTVFVKHFDLGTDDTNPAVKKRLETRFIVRSSDGNVYGVTYKWRADNSDADLVSAAGLDEAITIATASGTRSQTWHYPSQAECLTCHTGSAGGVLGVKTRQLNGTLTYPGTGTSDNQLRALNHIGLFNPVIQEPAIPGYSKLVAVTDSTATLENRFKSYIDANCASCHRPGGANVQLDARYDTPIYSQHIINGAVKLDLGIVGAKVVVPKDTAHSLLYLRTNLLDANKMPPLAHNLTDTVAVQMIANYINGLSLTAGADTISLQFKDTGAGGNNGLNVVTGTAGIQARNNWNTLAGSTGTNQALIDNNGTPSPTTASWTCSNTWSNAGPNTGGTDSLLKGYLDTTNTSLSIVTVNNIPFSIYNVIVYAVGDGTEHIGQYWAKGAASPGGSDTGGKVVHFKGDSSQALADATNTGVGNYVLFTGLTGGTCVITGQAYQFPGGTGDGFRGPLNGIQIVDATQTIPALNAVFANAGPTGGGQTITVTGANLLPGASFTLGGVPVAAAQYLSDKAYAIVTPSGTGSATLAYAGFNGTATLSNGYTYSASPGTIGDAISYNFHHTDQNGGVNPLGAAELAGVIARARWNNSTSNVNLATDTALTDNLGTNTGVTAGWSCNEHWTNGEVADSGGNYRMMRGYINETDTLPMFITASGLPAGFQQFDLYVYTTGAHGTATRHANLRVGLKTVGANLGTSVSYPYAGAGASGFLRVPDNNADTTQAGNYVLFPNVTPVNGAIRLDIQSPDSDYRLGIAGIQLVALAPVLTAALPNTGVLGGGFTVTLTGTDFRPNAQSITFGGAAATNIVYVDSTHYTVTAPAHSTGVVDVVMTDINGRTGTLAAQFTYSTNPPPALTTVTPVKGSTTGGTAITINGTNFRAGATVQIGGQNGIGVVTIPAANVTVVNSTTITCATPAAVPAGATGLTTVQVTNSDNTVGSLASAFTYTAPPPALASIIPSTGASSGSLASNAVTITASNHTFTATGVTVTIGGATVAAATVDDQHVTFVPPAHTKGAVDVFVTNGDSVVSNTLVAGYNYALPTLSLSTPNQGPTLGGNTVTLSGTNFGPAITLTVGGLAATNVTVLSASSLTFVVPASAGGATGPVTLVVSDNQTPVSTASLLYSYAARQPEFTTTAGKIPGVCATFYYNGSADGTFVSTGPATFDTRLPYQGKMVTTTVMAGPNSSAAPGTILNLIAANSTTFNTKVTGYLKINTAGTYTIFTASDDASMFYFGNTPATTSLVVNNNFSQGVTERSAQLGLAPGLHQFTILFGQGGGGYGLSASLSGPDTGNVQTIIPDSALFSDPAPAISSINPLVGSTGGNTTVTLTGSGFVAGANVSVNGVQAQSVTVASATSITFRTPGGAAGAVKVVVINPNGNADSIAFTYDATIFRNPDIPANTVAGSLFRYYNLAGPTLPLFNGVTPARVGAKTNANVLPETTVAFPIMQNDNHCQQITGFITIPYSGTWTFYTASDDGTTLYIGGTQVVNNNFSQGITTRAGTIGLNAGKHKFTLQFAQGGGGFGSYIGWGCSGAPATIPVDALGTNHAGAPSAANLIPDSAFTYVPPTWQGTGTASWSNAANWNTDAGLGAFSPVQSDTAFDAHESLVLRFPAVGTTPYTAINDAPNTLPVAMLELNSAVAGNSINGAKLQFGSGNALIAYPYQNGAAQVLLNSATLLQLGSGAVSIGTPISIQSTLTLRGNGSGLVTLGGALTNANGAGLIKNDASTFVIGGDASGFTLAPLTVSAGTLAVNSTLNAAAATVAAGAILRGTGTMGGAVTVAGTLFPGNAANVLTNDPKGTFTVGSADFSGAAGTLRARVWLKDATHVEADALVLTSTAPTGLKLDATSVLELRVQVPQGVTSVNNLDVELVHGGDAANNTYSAGFGNLSLVSLGGATNMSVLYVNKDFVANTSDTIHVVATQAVGQAPAPAISANSYNRIFLRFNGGVTPVKVDDFAAVPQGAGVLLKWNVISEYRNAGFNVWRRDVLSGDDTWKRVNATLLPGMLTHNGPRVCRVYDWPDCGTFEYRLESIDVGGVHEFHPLRARVVSDAVSAAFEALDGGAIDAAAGGLAENHAASRAATLSAAVRPARNGGGVAAGPHARVVRVDRNTDASVLASLGLTGRSAPAPTVDAPVIAPGTTPPWFAAEARSVPRVRPFTGAKVVSAGSGLLRIPQASLPPGFNARAVRIQRAGAPVSALAADSDGVVIFAPGYADDYTDKDAFFLIKSGAKTVPPPPPATGLFDAPSPQTTAPGFARVEYHDVYFDWSLRPYTYPPWFSNRYLTDGSAQDFVLNTPASTGDAAVLTVNVWSLTGGNTVSPDHNVHAFVNGTFVGSAEWDGGGMALALAFDVPPNTLNAGANTIELVTPTIDGVASQIAFVQSISAQYTKRLDAGLTGGGVAAPVEFSLGGNASRLCEVAGLASSKAWVVDTRDSGSAALVAYEARIQADGSYKIRFVAQPGGTGKMLIVPAGAELAPISVTLRKVGPVKGRPAYLAVGPQQFSAALKPLLTAHNREGLRSQFVDQEQLFDYYSFGRYGPESIRDAVKALRPRYLLLAGRSTYDYRNYSGASVDPMCPTFLISTGFWAQATSDALFADLGRGYPEIGVGRFPVNTVEELNGVVKHTLDHVGLPVSGWRGHLTADEADPNAGDFPAEGDRFAQNNSEIAWMKNYLHQPPDNDQPAVTASMAHAANGDSDVLVYLGHGNSARLGRVAPRILDADAVQAWSGDVVFLQCTCTANWFVNDVSNFRSVAIQALTQPQGGIAASLSTTTYCPSSPALDFMEKLLQHASTQEHWGGALLKAQQYAWQQSRSAGNETAQWYFDLMRTECLLGDPALPITRRMPGEK